METAVALSLFTIFIICMLAVDLFFFGKKPHEVEMRQAVGWSLFWIILGLSFTWIVYKFKGSEGAINYLTGYLIEKSLSVDNLFVFLLIFDYFQTPKASMHKVLFWGVLGAIVLRALFIGAGIALVSEFHWIVYIFGLFIIFSGIKLWFEKDKKIDPEKNPALKLMRKFIPMTTEYHSDHFFILRKGKKLATPLLAVLVVIETSDVIFAVDSIPAILAITYDPFVVFTSNIFAILGLRSLFFVLSSLMSLFHYLHYGLSFILIFIGTKMLISDLFVFPTWIALLIVFVALMLSILASLLDPKKSF